MVVHDHTGAVASLIDAVNSAVSSGPLSTVKAIELTREEMDEVVASGIFDQNVGQHYGDADVPTMRNTQAIKGDGGKSVVLSFFLCGVKVFADKV